MLIHGICGFILVFIGLYIVYKSLNTKFNHKLIGYIFVVLSIVVAALGSYFAFNTPDSYLVYLGIIAILYTIIGLVCVKLKSKYLNICSGLHLVILSLAILLIYQYNLLSVYSIGTVIILLSVFNIYYCNVNTTVYDWKAQHISAMITVVITMITALLLRIMGDSIILWLLPTIMLSPLIVFLKIKYAPKRIIKW